MGGMNGSTKPPPASPQAPFRPPPPVHAPSVPESGRAHDLVTRLTCEIVLRHATGARVLDVGGAMPGLHEPLRARAASLQVVPLPPLGEPLTLPEAGADLVLCLHTLPYLASRAAPSEARAGELLHAMAAGLRPGGTLLVDLDNPQSLRGAYYGVRHLARAMEAGPLVVDTPSGPDRFDTLHRFVSLLPENLDLEDLHGVHLLWSPRDLLATAGMGRVLEAIEWRARALPVVRRFAAHLLLTLRRTDVAVPRPAPAG